MSVLDQVLESRNIGVIIPTYNATPTIERALFSVINQTVKLPIRIIVSDDGSDDFESLSKRIEAISSAIPTHVTIHLLKSVENRGPAAARNIALKYVADCEFISFLDADDVWDPKKLEIQLARMIETDCNFSAHEYTFNLSKDKSALGGMTRKVKHKLLSLNDLLWGRNIFTPTIIVRSGFIKVKYREHLRTSEDWLFYIENLIRGGPSRGVLYLKCLLAGGFKAPIGESGATISAVRCHLDRRCAIKCLWNDKYIGYISYVLLNFTEWSKYYFIRKNRIKWKLY